MQVQHAGAVDVCPECGLEVKANRKVILLFPMDLYPSLKGTLECTQFRRLSACLEVILNSSWSTLF
ncbi:hypothetical protein Poly59_59390 [Rubripirellula reticaptiva]|uniref:Uncharacterized protein n=1 Tax=Rubripirellula reticaptiva TaxID=2528013 RepID=A0A5C6EEP5_9BACT|nr:hypothetical protein Poly59_59390 [Rubripirellula reticaptiva]